MARRYPLLKAVDWLETNFRPYNPEEELQVGLFREAIANALVASKPNSCPSGLIFRMNRLHLTNLRVVYG